MNHEQIIATANAYIEGDNADQAATFRMNIIDVPLSTPDDTGLLDGLVNYIDEQENQGVDVEYNNMPAEQ